MARDTFPGWRPARVVENRRLSNGSMWIELAATDDLPADYEPGHVLSVGLPLDGSDSLMRHAYTVSRGDASSRRFAHLYRVISGGRMTPRMSQLLPGATMFFHGPFHTPIQQEIHAEAERIVLIATGTGVGPLFGYAQKTLREGEARPVSLYASFREESHICLSDDLDILARRHANFEWRYSVTQPSNGWRGLTGRTTDWVPGEIATHKLDTFHFHLVGNGEMVHLVHRALHRAGVAQGRVSTETYFHHHAEPVEAEVEKLAEQFRRTGAVALL
jgi:NAD(P)H-flavin reductase